MSNNASTKDKVLQEINTDALKRLKRAEGQVGGIIRMVEEKKYCIDILTQILAVNSALRRASMTILSRHMKTCVSGAVRDGEKEGEKIIDEMMLVLNRYGI